MSITRQTRTLYSDFVEYKELDRATLSSIHPGILVIFDSTALASLYQYPRLAPATKSSVLSRSCAATHSSPTRHSRNSGAALDGASPVPGGRRPCSLRPRVFQRDSPRREGLALECPALRHPPAGPLHRPDYEDSRAHHRHRFHQRGPPRR